MPRIPRELCRPSHRTIAVVLIQLLIILALFQPGALFTYNYSMYEPQHVFCVLLSAFVASASVSGIALIVRREDLERIVLAASCSLTGLLVPVFTTAVGTLSGDMVVGAFAGWLIGGVAIRYYHLRNQKLERPFKQFTLADIAVALFIACLLSLLGSYLVN